MNNRRLPFIIATLAIGPTAHLADAAVISANITWDAAAPITGDSDVNTTGNTGTLHHFFQQISNHLSNIIEHVEALNVCDQSSVCSDPCIKGQE